MQKALFLDRDGVVIEDKGYPHLPEHLAFCKGAIDAMRAASQMGFRLVIVTNQSGIARGLFSVGQYQAFSSHLEDELARHDVFLDGQYFCPHLPNAAIDQWRTSCECRKPAPGLILKASEELKIDLTRSILVGDRWSDMEAARAAGVASYYFIDGGAKGPSSEYDNECISQIVYEHRGFKGCFESLEALIKRNFLSSGC